MALLIKSVGKNDARRLQNGLGDFVIVAQHILQKFHRYASDASNAPDKLGFQGGKSKNA
jgi:hypothetical protein